MQTDTRFNRRAAALSASVAALALACGPLPIASAATLEAGADEPETIIVTATRTRRRVQDEPIRVEVIGREEIEEKIIMSPGNISVLLSETGGLWVQANSAALGSSGIRIQGMSERYTLLLADGLPLYGQTGSIGLLQIPPTDLGRVEVIKGAASSLYGAAALGGMINLVSRRPGEDHEGEILANVTSQNGQDLTAFGSGRISESWSYSLTGGGHWQERRDLDGRGWADIPAYQRYTVRPRLFWQGANGGEALLTVGGMSERRTGGTLPGRTVPDGTAFVQGMDTERLDAGLTLTLPVSDGMDFSVRASAMQVERTRVFGTETGSERHQTGFAEASLTRISGPHTFVGGVAVQAEDFRSFDFPVFDYQHTVPGAFAQYDFEVSPELTLSASARADHHSEFGTFVSPRVSVLYRPGDWTMRASAAQGFFAPTPFVGSVEETGLSRLEPLAGLEAERADTLSFDIGRSFGALETNVIFFQSRVRNEAALVSTGTALPDGTARQRIVSAPGTALTQGSEWLVRYRQGHIVITASYMYTDARSTDPVSGLRRETPMTPRHSAGFVAMWEDHDRGRIGFEAYYTGAQELEDNPYRTRSKPYVMMGILGEINLGHVSLFLNAENLLDIRQSRYDPLVRPSRASDGRWTTDAWTHTDGFVVNGGIRVRFGGGHHH
ncbi:MAG: TonB-dependent receptor plug domain-containing protein [Caulobacterales bacterium]|uniref:TonB-dependent receptor plug domain-containing protein n=1 Tax=Glycocaulis sp. TaxID=1969725 RepID=UPI003F9EE93F